MSTVIEDNFNENSYIEHNPTFAYEDVEYKFSYIKPLLEKLDFQQKITILDVGGGGGFLGKEIAEYFIKRGLEVEFYALDVSLKMLEIQKSNNPYIKEVFNCYLEELSDDYSFDLALMVDVIEHIPKKELSSKKIATVSKYALYNIPIEINFFDLLKNIYMKNRYYKIQKKTLGHVHFFSFFGAKKHFKKFFKPIASVFPNYPHHILYAKTEAFNPQRENSLRKIELLISDWIYKRLKFLAPLLIQGSLFILGRTKSEE